MRYIGSKASVLDDIVGEVDARGGTGSFCDPFGGIGSVGSRFKSLGFRVYTSDILPAAHCFQVARIAYSRVPSFEGLRRHLSYQSVADLEAHLNDLRPRRSWLHREYSEKRSFFTSENAGQIEAVRLEINRWVARGLVDRSELSYLRACLIDAMDKVANTAGTYYAHLKRWDRKALRDFNFHMLVPIKGKQGRVTLGDGIDLLRRRAYNVIYLDPPYNGRDYGRYYHLPNTIASGRTPRPFGKSGVDQRRIRRSAFNSRGNALNAAKDMLACARFDLLLFHYTDGGTISVRDVRQLLRSRGTVEELKLEAIGYSSSGSRLCTHRLFVVTP